MISLDANFEGLNEERVLRVFAVFLACRKYVGILSPAEILDLLFASDSIPLDILHCENNKEI